MSADNCVVIAKTAKKQYIVKEISMAEFEQIISLESFYKMINARQEHLVGGEIRIYISAKKALSNATKLMEGIQIEYGIHYIDLTK